MKIFLVASIATLAWGYPQLAAKEPPRNIVLDAPAGRYVGIPIHWGSRDVALLESSGRIRVFETNDVLDHRVLDEFFQPKTLLQASQELQVELGREFETIVTGPYVIGVPLGETQRWEARFRSLLASYLRYFEVRGWPLRKPDFPLTMIVFSSRADFVRYSSSEVANATLADNLVGMYLPGSNRCLLYNQPQGMAQTDWAATEATIVHEAIHQLAYNTGIHERLFQHPLWFVEGLATMFEVPAFYSSDGQSVSMEQRIHREKLATIKSLKFDSNQLSTYLQSLVASDELFRSQPETAYALAWALTFYLVERMPKQYFELVALQRARGFQPYEAGDREMDFRTAFRTTPQQLAPSVLQLLRLD